MINNDPRTQFQNPTGNRLVLPAAQQEIPPTNTAIPQGLVKPEQLIRPASSPLPTDPLAKITYLWQKDPAYRVLMISVGLILIAGIIFATFASNIFTQVSPASLSMDTKGVQAQRAPTNAPSGTVDMRPTFPGPVGGKGSKESSQPPANQMPVYPIDTPTTDPTPTDGNHNTPPPNNGNLTVEFLNPPQVVANNTTFPVSYKTNAPNAQVTLTVVYSNKNTSTNAGSDTSDDNGFGTITWHIHVPGAKTFGNRVVARLQLTVEQDGQRGSSETITVQVF